MKLLEPIAQWHEEMTAFRRDLHMHPELAYEEVRTAAEVAEALQQWGVETHTGIGVTGGRYSRAHRQWPCGWRQLLGGIGASPPGGRTR